MVSCEPEGSPRAHAGCRAFRGIAPASFRAASAATSSATFVYRSIVTLIDECRSMCWITFMSTPAPRARVAAPWRSPCRVIGGKPASLISRANSSATSAGCSGLPSGSVKSKSFSTQSSPRRALVSSWRARWARRTSTVFGSRATMPSEEGVLGLL
ncbi:hypothetical protein DV36_01745 [Amycolatopsis mediterranei]|nr:hypothetical protein DV36_01745 [Amycolatopsis mediterranei]